MKKAGLKRGQQSRLLMVQYLIFESNSSGESPPPPPRALFGRDELVEDILGLVESLTPIALIGAGGIGKTSIALTILHHDRIKKRFGDNRRFVRCDQFPATQSHFLRRLSDVIGAGVENPENMGPLRPFLSSKEILIVLDNAESILDPQGTNAEEIYAVVEELSQFGNVCLFVTSRISTIPPDCEALDIPTLSMGAAHDAFYRIYKNRKRSDLVNDILERLDFHPLSITLLATVAYHNKWDTDRLTKEWERQRIGVLRTHHNKSLAATIELSLASPMFRDLGPDARDLLGVVAFFPQGVKENNLDWLFPTISDCANIFDKFCVLSLTYRSNGFITMLAPIRDHLYPKDLNSSPLLRATKERYFDLLSGHVNPGFEETPWITSEDVNVEHLLDVFTSVDTSSEGVWDACTHFMKQLFDHKPRLVMLGPRIEGLPDNHPSKPRCLFELSQLLYLVGSQAECKRILVYTLKLWRERGNNIQVARTLRYLAEANWRLHIYGEGISQAKESLAIYERLNYVAEQAKSLGSLALLLAEDDQADAAEEAVSRATSLSNKYDPSQARAHHHILSHICRSRGETEAAINHLNKALGIVSSPNPQDGQIPILHCLVHLLLKEGRLDDAQIHLERLKLHGINDIFSMGLATAIEICALCRQGKFEEAESESSRILGVCEKMGVSVNFLEYCKGFLQEIQEKMKNLVTSN